MRNVSNLTTGSVTLVDEGGVAKKWVEVGAPTNGRIVRVAINQIGGDLETTDVKVYFYNCADAEDSVNAAKWQCAPVFTLHAQNRGMVEFGSYPYRNADVDNVQSAGKLYILIDGLSDTLRVIDVTFTVET